MTKSKMIVLWGGEDILRSSIEFLLAAKQDWNVVSLSSKEDLDALVLAVETAQQDIVIIHQGWHSAPANLPLHLLRDHPTFKVVTLSLENNAIEVYSKQKIILEQTSDLIEVIEDEP